MRNFNNNFTCEDAELYYYDFICDDNSCSIPEAAIDHIHSCEICLKKTEQLKMVLHLPKNAVESHNAKVRNEINRILERHFAYIDKQVSCNDVKPFLPYLLDIDLDIKIPTPITIHLNSCTKCYQDLEAIRRLSLNKGQLSLLARALSDHTDANTAASQLQDSQIPQEKMQQLIDTVRTISERPESGVVTICRIDKAAKTTTNDDFGNLYAGFPITVERINNNAYQNEQSAGATISLKTNTASGYTVAPLARLLKPGVIAAAVILIAAGLFLSTPTVKAISIEQIYSAIEKIKNVYIANLAPDNTEPRQEFWISRERNIYITKTKRKTVFYDLDNGRKKTKLPDTNTTENIQLTGNQISGIKQGMYSFFGVMPFANISDIPLNAQWNRIVDETLKDDGVEIYVLTWTNKGFTGSKDFRKYRFYVNYKTNLPYRIEYYLKLATEERYNLINVKMIKYLDSGKFQAVVIEKGF